MPSSSTSNTPSSRPDERLHDASTVNEDRWLKSLLQATHQASPDAPGSSPIEDLERGRRLQERAMKDWAQWQREHLAQPEARELVEATGLAGAWGGSGHHPRRAPWRLLAAGALALAMVGAIWWTQRPDPALEELMRLDVLSLMAAGEI